VLVDAPIQDVTAGQVFPAEIIATNNGDVAAEGTVVETSLPDGVELVDVVEASTGAARSLSLTTRAAAKCSVMGRVVRCALGTIAPRTSKSVSLTLRAKRAMQGMLFGLRASGANVPLVERKMDPTAERAPCAVAGRGLLTGSNVGENICGSAGNDRINGGDGDDFITGGAGNDRINGGGGDDMILAGTGADTADGGIGNDVITLDGSGTARGGSGQDTFIVALSAKRTKKPKFKILDAQKGEKVLIRRGRAASNVTFTYNPSRRAVMVGAGLEVGVSS
jgi:hypothetical protein